LRRYLFARDPERRPEPVLVDRAELKDRQERASKLVAIARAEMANLYQQVAGSGHAILLTDHDGVVLDYVGDAMFTDTASRASLQTGAVWAERTQGTNGMGMPGRETAPEHTPERALLHQEHPPDLFDGADSRSDR
jgi:transcriptional regulator of acetoin/glycerol metabolism